MLKEDLEKFQKGIQENARIQAMIRNWKRKIQLDIEGSDQSFAFIIRSPKEIELHQGSYEEMEDLEAPGEIILKTSQEHFEEIFSGKRSPAQSYLDGTLECYAQDQDQIILDSISLIYWGI